MNAKLQVTEKKIKKIKVCTVYTHARMHTHTHTHTQFVTKTVPLYATNYTAELKGHRWKGHR